MISKQSSARYQLKTGDTGRLKYDSIVQDYLVTGVVTALVNAENVYLTEDGIRRINPTYVPTTFLVYPAEGVDENTLRAVLDRRFGKSAQNLGSGEEEITGSYEERIRARAEQVMAAVMEQNGAAHVEYAIVSGDTVIAGNSDSIKIKAFFNMSELVYSAMASLCSAVNITTKLFMAMSAAVVMMILSILMASEIRRQRRELGIMKGLGYTSKELMLQLAFRIMPAALLAVVIGTVLSVGATKLLVSAVGVVPIHLPQIIVLDLLILAFCFGCAWLGAGRIKKISVCELMTE
jgi:ABC-type antimicrobial peptide transport system permease subunit